MELITDNSKFCLKEIAEHHGITLAEALNIVVQCYWLRIGATAKPTKTDDRKEAIGD